VTIARNGCWSVLSPAGRWCLERWGVHAQARWRHIVFCRLMMSIRPRCSHPTLREQLPHAMAAGLWRCRIRRRSILIGTVVQLPVLVRPATTKYGAFSVHPVVAVDADDEALLGVAGARIWTRGEEPTPNHNDIPFDEKESRRWLEAAELAATHLAPVATQVIVVADREGDIYPMFARKPEAIDFVVRANHNRVLADGGTLLAAPAAWPVLGRVQIKVAPKRPGDKGRKARLVLKARTVTKTAA
jgi:hypothetical protein